MRKLNQLISASILLLCLACVDTETVYERLADSCVGEVDHRVLLRLRSEMDTLQHYFIRKGLLADRTGASIYRVYEQDHNKRLSSKQFLATSGCRDPKIDTSVAS